AEIKSEIRISNPETNETLNPETKSRTGSFGIFCFLIICICFEFRIFEFRIFCLLLLHSTGHRFTFQMSAAYSAIVRSLENFPEPATFKIAFRAQASDWAYNSRNR